MVLSASWANYKKQKLTNMKMSPTLLKYSTKIQGIDPMGLCAPWAESFMHNKNLSKYRQQNKHDFFLKL